MGQKISERRDLAIQLKNVSKIYKLFDNDRQRIKAVFSKKVVPKKKQAINDVSFRIEKGDSVALFGRNGAGKSTLLKLITGVIFPTSGDINVTGRVSALLELTAGFDPEFTGRENIYFRGQLLGMQNSEIKELEDEIIDFADLGPYIDQPVRTYSSGMKARLGFAINANIKPEILIVDEALSVGDKAFRIKCNQKINEIVESGVTFLFVTHSVAVAKSFCNRGIVMKSGNDIFDGNIDDAAEYYESLVRAELVEKRKLKAAEDKISYDSVKRSVIYPEYIKGIVTKAANFRTGPGKEFDFIDQLVEGTEILLKGFEKFDDGREWYSIEYNGTSGYIYKRAIEKKYIEFEKEMICKTNGEAWIKSTPFIGSATITSIEPETKIKVRGYHETAHGKVYKIRYSKYSGFLDEDEFKPL